MALQILTGKPKLCCPAPLECMEYFYIYESGTIWKSYIPIKGTFIFNGSFNPAAVTIRFLLFNGKVVTRILQPGQSFAFTGDNVRKIEVSVANGPADLYFEFCTQTLTDINCKQKNPCCPDSLQCTFFSSYWNIPINEDFLLWQSTVPVTGSFEINPSQLLPQEVEINVIIKRFNQPDVVETITSTTVIRSENMKALLVNISNLENPAVLSVSACLRDQVNKKSKS